MLVKNGDLNVTEALRLASQSDLDTAQVLNLARRLTTLAFANAKGVGGMTMNAAVPKRFLRVGI